MSRARLEVVGSLVALCCAGCSSTIAVRRPLSASALDEVNDAINGRAVTVTLIGEGQAAQFAEATVGSDATQLLKPQSGSQTRQRSVPTAALQQIAFTEYSIGAPALRGLAIGATIGGILGALAIEGAATDCAIREGANCPSGAGSLLAGGVVGAVMLGLLGAGIGAAIPHTTIIEFSDAELGGAVIVRPPFERRYGPGQWLEKCDAPEDCGRGLTCVDRICVKE